MSESVYINIDDLKVTKPSQSGQPTKIDIKPGAKVYKRGGSGKKSFVKTGTASATGIQDAQSRMIQQGLQEQARQQELVKQEQAKAQAEKIRIEQLNQKLLREGARQRQEILRNQAGQRIKTTTTELNRINKGVSTNAKIYKYENLDTGETRYTTYEKPRSGMPRRLSGGVTLQGQSSSDIIQIKNELSSNGLVPVTNSSGQVVAFRSPDTQKSYSYSEGGFNAYQKDYGQAGAVFRKQIRESQEQGMSVANTEKESQLQEADSWFRKEIQKATSEQAKVKSEIKKLSSEGKKSEAVKLARESNELNNSLTGYRVGLRITEILQGVLQIPGVVKQLIKQPGSIIPLTASLWEGTKADLKETWQLAKVSPNQAIAKIGTDYFTGAFVGKAFKLTGKVTGKVARRINPKWKSFASGTIEINAPKEIFVRRGNQVFLKTRVGKVQAFVSKSLRGTKRAGQFKKFQTARGITLTKGTIGKGLPLSEQLKFGGSRGTITTAQADRLVGFLKRQKLVRKPIPGEATFSSLTKKLLQRFDDGKISSKQFKLLNQRIIKETGGKTLLERSLYADPTGKVRFTRLGKDVSREASLRDILKGDVSFRKAKPQIIVFPDDQIAKLPKQLKDIYNKLKQNKRLTPSERNRLVEFQVSNKGRRGKQWKPIGDVEYKGGVELEVSLSPGNEIRRVKKLGITEINGVPVEITQAKVVRLKSKTTTLLNKAKKGAINQNEIKSLSRALKKELNMQVKKSDIKNLSKNIRRSVERKPYLPVGRVALSRGVLRVGKSLRQVGRRTARTTSRVSSRISKPTARINRRAKITRPNVPRPPRPNVPRPPRPNVPRPPRPNVPRPPRPNVREPIARLKPEEFKQSTLPKAQQTFYVIEKVRGKYKKLHLKPLTMKDARDYATHSIDNRLSKTAFFVPLGKSRRVLKAPKQIQNYYAQNSQKFRPYRIQYGQRKQLVNGFIEKRKFFNDKPGERVVAKNLRARATVKRTITPMQRQILLKRLAMARAVRMRNLRR